MPNDPQGNSIPTDVIRRRHESRLPRIQWTVWVAGLVLLGIAACLLVIRITHARLQADRTSGEPAGLTETLTTSDTGPLERFPKPNLQVRPREDLEAFRAREATVLNRYGWVDRSNGIVHIPIERAMELIVERGLPSSRSNRPVRTGESPLDLIRDRSQTP